MALPWSASRRLERRLSSVVVELARAREDLEVAKEQYVYVLDDDEQAKARSVVTGQVADRLESDTAHRQSEVLLAEVRRKEAEIVSLERERDDLLSRYGSSSP